MVIVAATTAAYLCFLTIAVLYGVDIDIATCLDSSVFIGSNESTLDVDITACVNIHISAAQHALLILNAMDFRRGTWAYYAYVLFVGYCYYVNISACIQVKVVICCEHTAFIYNILFSVNAEIFTSTNRASVTYSFLIQSFILAFFHIGLINDVFTFEDYIHSGTDVAALIGDVLVRIQLDVFTSNTATKVIDVLTFKVYCSVSPDGANVFNILFGVDGYISTYDKCSVISQVRCSYISKEYFWYKHLLSVYLFFYQPYYITGQGCHLLCGQGYAYFKVQLLSCYGTCFHESRKLLHVASIVTKIRSSCELCNLLDDKFLLKITVTQALAYLFRVSLHSFKQIVAGQEFVIVCILLVGFNKVLSTGVIIKLINLAVDIKAFNT